MKFKKFTWKKKAKWPEHDYLNVSYKKKDVFTTLCMLKQWQCVKRNRNMFITNVST